MRIKKLIATTLTILAVLSCFSLTSFAQTEGDAKELRFGENGKFTILNISDIQDDYPLNYLCKRYIADTIDLVKPDLVILTGDNISGNDIRTKKTAEKAIREFMDIFEEKGVKVAAVYGNHDVEDTNASKEFQLSVYQSYSCYVGKRGLVNDDRLGTYNLPILSSSGEKYAFNLWLTDSGDYNYENDLEGYAAVTKEQIEWYKKQSLALKEANGGEVVPSINFQHIIVPEIFDALTKAEKDTEGAVMFTDPVTKEETYYVLPENAKGALNETPCPPFFNNGQFDAMLEMGDVLATVSGHDHTNAFEVEYKGINIINTPTISFMAYNGDIVGSRVFVLDENDAENYETYIVDYDDVYEEDNKLMKNGFAAFNDKTPTFKKIVSWFKYMFYRVTENVTCLFN